VSVVTRPAPAPEVEGKSVTPDSLPLSQTTAVPRDSLPLRVATFAALAAFGCSHWMGLVEDPPGGRTLLLVAVATAGAYALGKLRALPAHTRFPLAVGVIALVFIVGFLAAGMRLYYVWPSHWDELADGINRGMGGVRSVNWPYEGQDSWVRDTILLGAPLLLGLATALAFWPARRGATVLRGAGLVCLLVLYGTAVTEHEPGQPLLRGLFLLFLVGAWLWLPRMATRDAATGAALVLTVGVFAIPLSAGLDADEPWWDYRAWDWFGSGKVVSFNWQHSYGPLDWPRDGTTLLNVRSSRPHYWKAETLDTFDGLRWRRLSTGSSIDADNRDYEETPSSYEPSDRSWDYYEWNPNWDEEIQVTVRALRSDLIVGAGTTYQVFDAGRTDTDVDGTTYKLDEPLEKGDTYTVRSYAPEPTPTQMRGAPRSYPDSLEAYTTVFLPPPGVTATTSDDFTAFGNTGRGGPPRRVVTGMWPAPNGPAPGAERALRNSPYVDVYDRARRLTDGKATAYDAVVAIQNHLRRNYRYNERPPTRDYPLVGFLFEDRFGYCQQFSGAMALMLRMVGIPARVATGFTRGSYNRDTKEYRIRDLDAHSWVEVHFNGIGWVTFDPTPAATPAEGQAPDFGSAVGALHGGDIPGGDASGTSDRSSDVSATGAGDGGGLGWWFAPVLAAVVIGGAAAAFAMRRARRHHELSPGARSEALLGELPKALTRLGWTLPAGTTLLSLEPRLRRMAGSASARYAAELRKSRYDPASPEPPDLAERRALRRELGAPRGLRGRLLALIALPPGGPRTPRAR
jgi:protein-glutamine gamma-glutamyltransferase